jgi:hypothetical protein
VKTTSAHCHPNANVNAAPSADAASSAVPVGQHGKAHPEVLWKQETQQARTERVMESDFYDDFCQNHVMKNLQALGESHKEAMFILSQLNFGNYLNQPSYAAVVAELGLKVSCSLF